MLPHQFAYQEHQVVREACCWLTNHVYMFRARELIGVQGRYHLGEEPIYACVDHEQCRHSSTCPFRLLSPKISTTWFTSVQCATSRLERTLDAFITILNGYSERFSAAAALVFYQPTGSQPATSNNLGPPCPGAVGMPVRRMSLKHSCLMSQRGQERRI